MKKEDKCKTYVIYNVVNKIQIYKMSAKYYMKDQNQVDYLKLALMI